MCVFWLTMNICCFWFLISLISVNFHLWIFEVLFHRYTVLVKNKKKSLSPQFFRNLFHRWKNAKFLRRNSFVSTGKLRFISSHWTRNAHSPSIFESINLFDFNRIENAMIDWLLMTNSIQCSFTHTQCVWHLQLPYAFVCNINITFTWL